MTKHTILIRATAPSGFRWKIIADGQTVKSGTTATEFEARMMAEAELKEIQSENGPLVGGLVISCTILRPLALTRST